MRDQQNVPLTRPAYILTPQATNPIPAGSIGSWLDLNGVTWSVAADGAQTATGQTGRSAYPPVRLVTAAALAAYAYSAGVITASSNGVWLIDGKALVVGNRILLTLGAAASDNGIYTVTTVGTASVKTVLTRASDMNTTASLQAGGLVQAGPDGAANAGNLYELVTASPMVLDTTSLAFAVLAELSASGVVPAARVAFSANPSDADTLTIGGSSFTFKTTLVTATTTTQVKILGSAALTLAALLDAINGVTNANVVANTTPFALSVVADAVSATVLRLRKATARGGAAVPGTVATTALAASISGGASAWSAANLNVSGKYPKLSVTAEMITNASFQIELPFTPSCVVWNICSSTGVIRGSELTTTARCAPTDAVTISGNAINLALAGGSSPATQATDVFTFMAFPS